MTRVQKAPADAADRAQLSCGTSASEIHQAVRDEVIRFAQRGDIGKLLDIGCGTGGFASLVSEVVTEYTGVDIVRYDGFPPDQPFMQASLDSSNWPLPDASADVAVSIETIEHLESPRAMIREMVRIVRPGGLIIVTTPNQTSLLSKMTLLLRNEFNAFQERPGLYPTHISALLPIDLMRIGDENNLLEREIRYVNQGRIPGTAARWPRFLSGRHFCDNVMLRGVKPLGGK